jgi:hypothetical protein
VETGEHSVADPIFSLCFPLARQPSEAIERERGARGGGGEWDSEFEYDDLCECGMDDELVDAGKESKAYVTPGGMG